MMIQVVAIDYFNGDGLPADRVLNVSSFLADACTPSSDPCPLLRTKHSTSGGGSPPMAPRPLALHSTRSLLRSKRKALPSLGPRVTASAVRPSIQSSLPLNLMCTAGRYTFDLAFDNIIQCAVVSHPSLLNLPEDLEVTHIILIAA